MLTDKQRNMMEHACALRHRSNPFYRNYYVIEPEQPDDLIWQELVGMGFAVLAQGPNEWMPYNVYALTPEGIAEVRKGTQKP